MSVSSARIVILIQLAVASTLAGCGVQNVAQSSDLTGTPHEGDSVIAQLRSQYSQAQVIDRPQVASTILGRSRNCRAFDARSYQSVDHGANNLEFRLLVFRADHGIYNVRYVWLTDSGWRNEIVNAGIDAYGFGIPATTTGACAGMQAVNYVRRQYDDSLIIETVQLNSCRPLHEPVTVPVTRDGVSATRYIVCGN